MTTFIKDPDAVLDYSVDFGRNGWLATKLRPAIGPSATPRSKPLAIRTLRPALLCGYQAALRASRMR